MVVVTVMTSVIQHRVCFVSDVDVTQSIVSTSVGKFEGVEGSDIHYHS